MKGRVRYTLRCKNQSRTNTEDMQHCFCVSESFDSTTVMQTVTAGSLGMFFVQLDWT